MEKFWKSVKIWQSGIFYVDTVYVRPFCSQRWMEKVGGMESGHSVLHAALHQIIANLIFSSLTCALTVAVCDCLARLV